MSEELFHYGTPHYGTTSHSGRYPWDPTKHNSKSYMSNMSFLEQMTVYKSQGMSDNEVAKAMDLSINDFRKYRSIARAAEHAALVTRAQRLRDHGYGPTEIGRKMGGVSEGTVRGWLKERETTRNDKIQNVVDILEEKVKKGEMIDVGLGSELYVGVKKTTFDTALKVLKDKGYVVDELKVQQPLDPTKATTVKYLAPPGTTKKEAFDNRGNINLIKEHSFDGGETFMTAQAPTSVSLDRVHIVYTDENGNGGVSRDGMIGIRRNVEDLSLGESSYAQVRIAVNEDGKDKYYIKGMAIYDDSIPKGKDIVVYSNKKEEQGVAKALKPLKEDNPDDPFGATIRAEGQNFYASKDGNYVKDGNLYILDPKGKMEGERYNLSPINKLKSEGDWENGSKTLSSQFLSKQPVKLINTQLDLTYKDSAAEFEDIMSITNPVVKKKLLKEFAEGCDKDAVELKAAALPRQTTKVILPVPELKDDEVYAPTYKQGEHLVLIRYPHAGTFEIPYLKVNNNNPEAKKLIGNATDAIGINGATASKLSGADYDGDFVVTIPVNDKVKVKWDKALDGLKGFDPSDAYPGHEGMKVMTDKEKQKQMGIVSNLITDMTLLGAEPDEMERAVKHSMVVIDAQKHELNWKLSEKDNNIEALKAKYQKNPGKNKKGYGGATTLISRAGSEQIVEELINVTKDGKVAYKPDPETGKWLKAPSGREISKVVKDSKGNVKLDENGKPIYEKKMATMKKEAMALTDDARTLISTYNTPQEKAYANYANKMKALANKARKEELSIALPKKDPEASKVYAAEVETIMSKLEVAKSNKPLERQAQLKTSVKVSEFKEKYPEVADRKDKFKKEKQKMLTETRSEIGAKKQSVVITDKEWEAIQSRAISGTKLLEILNNADMDRVRDMATPKQTKNVAPAKVSRIKALSASGNTIADIAEIMNLSPSTVSKYLKS